jgi:hypothetical protein
MMKDNRLPEALQRWLTGRGLIEQFLVQELSIRLHLHADEILLVCGSVVDGLANSRSDLDVLLITSRNRLETGSSRDLLLGLGATSVDVCIVQTAEAATALSRLRKWHSTREDPRRATDFNYQDQKLLHRILYGFPLMGAEIFRHLVDRSLRDVLLTLKVDASTYFGETYQLDLAGFLEVGDRASMRHAARELLGCALDACLAIYRLSQPNPKWRAAQLARMPREWEASIPGRTSGQSALQMWLSNESFGDRDVVSKAYEICTFARRALPSARASFSGMSLSGSSADNEATMGAKHSDSPSLPALRPDVAVRFDGDAFRVFRLNIGRQVFKLAPHQYQALMLFDGSTTFAEATVLCSAEAVEFAQEIVDLGDLAAGPLIDPTALARLLTTDATLTPN